MASASASSLRCFRSFALALGFAVFLAAAPGAIVVTAHATPSGTTSRAAVEQEPEPVDQPTQGDPGDEVWTEDEDDDDTPPDTLAPALPVNPSKATPDSIRTVGSGAQIPVGAAPAETLGYKPPVGARPAAKASEKSEERRTLLGIHPMAFLALIVAGHIMIVGVATKR